jgi:hypothetical protein
VSRKRRHTQARSISNTRSSHGNISWAWRRQRLRRKQRKPRPRKRRLPARLRHRLRRRLPRLPRRSRPARHRPLCGQLLQPRPLLCDPRRERLQRQQRQLLVAYQPAPRPFRRQRLLQLGIRRRIPRQPDQERSRQRRPPGPACRLRSVQRRLVRLERRPVLRRELPVRRGRRVHPQRAKDFLRVPDSPAHTKIVPALPRECDLPLLQVRSGPAVHQDPVAHLGPEALRRDFRSDPEDVRVRQSRSAVRGLEPPVEFPRRNLGSLCTPASRRRPEDGRRLKNGMRKASAGFIRCERAQALVRAAPRMSSQSRPCSGSRAL